MPSGSKKGTQIYFSLKSPRKRTPSGFPNRAPMEREARLQGILHISHKPCLSGSPWKELSLKVPFMESLAERGLTTRALLHSSIKVSGIWASPPHSRFLLDGKGPLWREMPASRDFPSISSRVPSEGAPPEAPSTERLLQREMLHPHSPVHPALKVPSR